MLNGVEGWKGQPQMNAQGVLAEATGKFKARLGAMLREKNDAVMEKNDVQDVLVLRGEEVDALVVGC